MSGKRPSCTICGGWVGLDLHGQPHKLCGWCHRGLERGKCIDCVIESGRLRCPPCHRARKEHRDVVTTPQPPRTVGRFQVACVRCDDDIHLDRPGPVVPVCARCKAKAAAEDRALAAARKRMDDEP